MVDAVIEYPDGRGGALEIIGDHDGQFYGLWKKLQTRGHQARVDGLAAGWVVVLYHHARLRDMLGRLPELLRGLEDAGLRDLRNAPDDSSGSVHSIAEDIGVRMAYSAVGLERGQVRLRLEGWSGISRSISLAAWIQRVLDSNPDVAPKLRGHPGVSERHVFIWVTTASDYAVQHTLEHRGRADNLMDLPHPRLPDGLTHVWIAGQLRSQGAIAWSARRGWWRTPWEAPTVPTAADS
jgi:hypothetical protein